MPTRRDEKQTRGPCMRSVSRASPGPGRLPPRARCSCDGRCCAERSPLARAAVHTLSPARLRSGTRCARSRESGVGGRSLRGEHGRALPSLLAVAKGCRGPPTSGIGGQGQAEWVRKGEITCCCG